MKTLTPEKNKRAEITVPAPSVAPHFVKAKVVATLYNVTPATIFLWARQGKIPSVSFQSTIRFDLEKVRAVIEGGGQ